MTFFDLSDEQKAYYFAHKHEIKLADFLNYLQIESICQMCKVENVVLPFNIATAIERAKGNTSETYIKSAEALKEAIRPKRNRSLPLGFMPGMPPSEQETGQNAAETKVLVCNSKKCIEADFEALEKKVMERRKCIPDNDRISVEMETTKEAVISASKKAGKIFKDSKCKTVPGIEVNCEIASAKIKKSYHDINEPYNCPVDVNTIAAHCKVEGFAHWKKAAKQFHQKGYFVKSRNFKDGGGYDLWILVLIPTEKDAFIYEYERAIHPRQIVKVISQFLEIRKGK